MQRLILIALLTCATAVISAQTTQPCPCCASEYRQFDFWVGDWEAFAPNGQQAGTNRIVIIQDSCIIQENWRSAAGNFTGTSYNYYDRNGQSWNQVWIDNQGGHLVLKGSRKGNQMILSSAPVPDGQGNMVTNRVTWTANDDGTVRQLWETTTDNKTWTAVFDGLYKRKS